MAQRARIKALSYNIHKGFSPAFGKFVLEQMRKALRSAKADLVFLQEVQGDHRHREKWVKGWPSTTQFQFLARDNWHHFAYGKNAVYNAGHHGNAILSKFPFLHWENLDISTNRLEKRGLLHGVIHLQHHNRELHVICLHLNLLNRGRRRQLSYLCDRIEAVVPAGAALIIGGDFNDWRLNVSRTLINRLQVREAHLDLHEKHARTFPSWLPLFQLDRIYVRGFQVVRAHALHGGLWQGLSDHAAVFSELELLSPGTRERGLVSASLSRS